MVIDHFKGDFPQIPQGSGIKNILNAALNAVLPDVAIKNHIQRDGNWLNFYSPTDPTHPIDSVDLGKIRKVRIVGIGKAAGPMAHAVVILLNGISFDGFLALKHPTDKLPPTIVQVVGGHPVPNEASLTAGQRMKTFLGHTQPDDLVLFLISGGGSALNTLPEANISLESVKKLTSDLLRSGATIQQINTIRKRIDQVKGGGLARMCGNGRIISLILSDVIGNPLDIIASGPTVQDGGTNEDALAILREYDLLNSTDLRILQYLSSQPGLDDLPHAFPDVQNIIIGDNDVALQAAAKQARLEGFETLVLPSKYNNEVRVVAEEFMAEASTFLSTLPMDQPFCVLAGGEPTVKMTGTGMGGRNQQLALLLSKRLENDRQIVVTLATDGEDGPTDAAGAIASIRFRMKGEELGLNINEFLQNNDAYHYFEGTQGLLRTGPTGTNVNDLLFLFGY